MYEQDPNSHQKQNAVYVPLSKQPGSHDNKPPAKGTVPLDLHLKATQTSFTLKGLNPPQDGQTRSLIPMKDIVRTSLISEIVPYLSHLLPRDTASIIASWNKDPQTLVSI